ncbi:unnamed protein product [Orchesella dallaii]
MPQSQSRTINDMRHRIFSLEGSMKSVDTEVHHLSKQNIEIVKYIQDQKNMLEKLDQEFAAVENVLSSHGDVLNDIEKLTHEHDTRVASSSTCGGVLVGQAGSITFNSDMMQGRRRPSSCVWTIRANNRASIKILTHQINTSGEFSDELKNETFVVEIFKTNSTTNRLLKPKLTKLQKNMHYLFDGPIIFLVTFLLPYWSDFSRVDLHLQFEGTGKLVERNTFFTHNTLVSNSGNFSSSQLETRAMSDLEQLDENDNFTLDYTTIVVSNFSTKVYLQVILDNQGCSNGESFLVILMGRNNTSIIDCCKTKCEGRNALINFGDPFIVIITSHFQQRFPFRLMWVAEEPYYESEINYNETCGGIVGGILGTISYKRYQQYLENERCIWVIVPQPRPLSVISINVHRSGINDKHGHLYAMELTDAYGKGLPDAPRITSFHQSISYQAGSREVYIVFYSDSFANSRGYGFDLSWMVEGYITKTDTDVNTHFKIYKNVEGSAESATREFIFAPATLYQVFIFTPIIATSENYGMQLHLNQNLPVRAANHCIHDELNVFTSARGIFKKDTLDCSFSDETLITASDGMAVLVLNSQEQSPVMTFKWKEAFGNTSRDNSRIDSIVVEDNVCGGVIIGDDGILRYKMNVQYWNNELCVWLLLAPNSGSITLNLIQNGFEECCDILFVSTIDPKSGGLTGNRKIISSDSPSATFQESLLILTFSSDSSTRGKGFTLEFSGSDHIENPENQYILRHRRSESLHGTVQFPSSDWDDGEGVTGRNKIYIIASSLTVRVLDGDDDPLIPSLFIDWNGGVFRKGNDSCVYDSLSLYASTSHLNGGSWLLKQQFPSENDTFSCPNILSVPEKTDVFNSGHAAFLAIYKPVSDQETQDIETRFHFDYYLKSIECGGVFREESDGYISYKEDTTYLDGETCIWLVEVPEAETISFHLEKEGFEKCCDYVTINSIDPFNGIYGSATLRADNRTATVQGPVAIVTFVSDRSITGFGFRILFAAETQASQESPFRYRLDSYDQRSKLDFAYEVKPNEVVVVAFSLVAHHHRQIYEEASLLRLNVTSFRPQVDESCQSDTLTVYTAPLLMHEVSNVSMNSHYIKPFAAVDVMQEDAFLTQMANKNCTPFVDKQFKHCNNLLDCHDAPIRNNMIVLHHDAFVVIYTSVNVTSNLKFRGFVLKRNAISNEEPNRTLGEPSEYEDEDYY